MYIEYYIMGIIVLPGILLAIYAQTKVQSTFSKYNEIWAECGRSASEIARLFLDNAGLQDIQIIKVKGTLTDYYNHSKKTLALSESVYDSMSVAAIGVACHEVGHALQYKTKYAPIILRNIVVHMCNFANNMLWVLIILGALFYYTTVGTVFLWIGVGVFGLSVLLNLITLPVEYNASHRATKLLLDSTVLTADEVQGAKKVLNSAALTYVASLVVSILNLLRLILAFLATKKRD
ncbi:MAG: zinc metallopeptidase [Christensenellales bacterium]